jgi:murein DD-endopeptidase MepM/ murein hydrolase activator NlpD
MGSMKLAIFNIIILIIIQIPSLAQVNSKQKPTEIINEFDEDEIEIILDSIENEVEYLDMSLSDELYKNLWCNSNIRYSNTIFAEKTDTLVFTLISAGDNLYVHPFKGKVISKYGPRNGRMHTGTDIKLQSGDSVLCAFDGRVRLAKRFSGYGNMVLIRHNNGLETVYSHLKTIDVKVNDFIKAGDLIGLGGRTGRATTDHLHFETRIFGEPFDSNKYIDFENFTLRTNEIYYLNKRVYDNLDNIQIKTEPVAGSKHTISKGDTLWNISKRYNTTVKAICDLNNISQKHILKIGSTLLVQ